MPKIVYEGHIRRVEIDMDEVVYREDGDFIEIPARYSQTEGPRYIPVDRIYHIDFETNQ